MTSVLTHQLWSCVAGAATVALVGLVGRRVAGPRAGVIAAVFAALYPNLWIPDGSLQAETLAMFFVVLAVLLAYRYRERPALPRLALVGVACGLGALARSELILLLPALVIPLAWTVRTRPVRDRVLWGGAAFAAALAVIAPWSVYNATRFTHPEVLSAQSGPLLSSANCDSTYYGKLKGYFDINCTVAVDRAHGITIADDQSVEDAVNRRAAFEYVRGHLSRLPAVEGIRLLRIVGLWHTGDYVRGDWYVEGRRPLWASWASLYTFWAFAVLSIGGVAVLRRRTGAPPVFPLLVPVGVMFVTVMLTYASTRFRTTAEPSFAILAAVAVDALYRRLRGGSGAGEEVVGVAGDDGHDGALRVDARSLGQQ
jgi:4-amino-4-deoxy-L-arabinose transferase-like glycosyltransferase